MALLLCIITFPIIAQPVAIGKRTTFRSEILGDKRSFQVCLPASYFYNSQNIYPVIYMIDGDYYFHFLTGLVEQLSVSEQIPEMIVVGVSGKGSPTYRKNCQPYDIKHPEAGNAEDVQAYIEKELMPYINGHYRTNGYDVLAGHSVAGLFTINTLFNKPGLFDAYIAVSPSMWKLDSVALFAEKIMAHPAGVKTPVYITLANEEGMKVDQLVNFLETRKPDNIDWQYRRYEKESHASTALPSLEWALKDLFGTWRVKDGFFNDTLNFKSIGEYAHNVRAKYGTTFRLPDGVIGYTATEYYPKSGAMELLKREMNTYFPSAREELNNQIAGLLLADSQLNKAIDMYNMMVAENLYSFKAYRGIAKVYAKRQQPKEASHNIRKAIRLVKEQQGRQWQINELVEERQ